MLNSEFSDEFPNLSVPDNEVMIGFHKNCGGQVIEVNGEFQVCLKCNYDLTEKKDEINRSHDSQFLSMIKRKR